MMHQEISLYQEDIRPSKHCILLLSFHNTQDGKKTSALMNPQPSSKPQNRHEGNEGRANNTQTGQPPHDLHH